MHSSLLSISSRLLAAGLLVAAVATTTICSAAPCERLVQPMSSNGLNVPANITRGVPFEITYQFEIIDGGPTYLYATYGIAKSFDAKFPALGYPNFVREDGSVDTGTLLPVIQSEEDNLTLAFTLSLPKREDDSIGNFVDEESIFGMALFGVQGINLVPVVTQMNQTTYVSQP